MARARTSTEIPAEFTPDEEPALGEHLGTSFPRLALRRLLLKALQRRLVFIVAPTGYGKSIALRDAVAHLGMPTAWYSATEDEHPLRPLYSSVLRAIARPSDAIAPPNVVPGSSGEVGDAILSYLGSARIPGLRIVVDGMDRASHPGELCSLIQHLLDNGPESLGAAITSSSMPNVRSQGLAQTRQFALIGPDRLVFTPDEVGHVVREAWGEAAAARYSQEVNRLTGGWPRGVAALLTAFSSEPESTDALTRIAAALMCHPSAGHLLDGLDHADRELLLAVSFLPTIEPGDGDTLVGVKGVHARLRGLSQTPLVSRLGVDRYAVAAPIRDRLTAIARAEWDAGRVLEHLSGVGRLLELRGDHDNSLRAFVDAGDGEGVTRLLRSIGLERVLQRDPHVFAPVAPGLARCERLGLEGRLLLAYLSLLEGDVAAWERACSAMEDNLPSTVAADRVSSSADRDLVSPSSRAIRILSRALPSMPSMPLMWDGWLQLRRGLLEDAESRVMHALASVKDGATSFVRGWALVAMGRMHVLRGAYSAARETLRRAQAGPSGGRTFLDLLRLQTVAALDAHEGCLDEAMAHAETAHGIAEAIGVRGIARELLLEMGRIAVWRGEPDRARQRIAQAEQDGCDAADLAEVRAWAALAAGVRSEAVRTLDLHVDDGWWEARPWALLLRGHLLAAEGEGSRGCSTIESVRAAAAQRRWTHVEANALMCQSFWTLNQGEEHQARELLRTFWESVAVHGFRFMPVSDSELVLWAGRAASSWWPEWRLLTKRLMAPAIIGESRTPFGVATAPSILIDTLGPLRMQVGGVVHSEEWKSNRKAKRFFELLLSRHGLRISMDEAADVLWPDADPDRITHRLHNEVSNLRRVLSALGIHGHLELRREHGFYRLYCSEQVRITHLAFEAMASQGLEDAIAARTHEALIRLREAVSLYRGPFLEDARYEEFAEPERTRLSDLMSRSLRTLADSPLIAVEEAMTWWRRALEHDPCDEEAYRGIVELCARTGRVALARRHLETLREKVVEELGVPMPEWVAEFSETFWRE